MKKETKILILPLLLTTLLFSCSSNNQSSSTSTSINHPTNEPTSEVTNSSSDTNKNSKTIDFYALNDLHGRISEDHDAHEPGLAKMSTYLKDMKAKNPEGYVFLSTGDMWQDTYESRTNNGFLITECLEAMECETFTLGNHEFDWGVQNILNNKALTKNTTFLCANVYNYPNEDEFANLGEKYKIIERKGVRIGIIGTIGSTQNTSITSSIWENLSFRETTKVVQDLSDELRTEKDCDIVLWGTHANYASSDPYEVTAISPVSNKRYVDAVFNAHSHKLETFNVNDVPFVQSGAHGKSLGHIQLSVDEEGNVTCEEFNSVGYNQMYRYEEDPAIVNLINKYHDEEYFKNKDQVIGTLTSSKFKLNDLYAGSLLAKATYEMYKDQMKDVDIIINNGARDDIKAGKQTRETIFNMLPFTNKTYIVRNIKGEDIINELKWNYYYKVDGSLVFEPNKYYTVASIDYILLHKDENRNYNYFPSYKEENIVSIIDDYCDKIVCDYLLKVGSVDESEFHNSHYKY